MVIYPAQLGLRLFCTSCLLETRHSAHPTPHGSPTHYESLGLDASASSKQIKVAFIELSKKYHPDVNPDNPDAVKRFHDITEAYGVLNNPVLRRKYDRGRLGRLNSIADREAVTHTVSLKSLIDSNVILVILSLDLDLYGSN